MPSVTTIDGYTFSNLGPVTTTFTPPASCVASDTANLQIAVTNTESSILYFQFAQQCSLATGLDCVPPGSNSDIKPTSTIDTNPTQLFNRAYYSPGLYCPSGWSTVGKAEYSNNKVTGQGVFNPTPEATLNPFGIPDFEVAGTLLMSLLDPSETAIACCPSSMTGNIASGCWSTVPDYKPTVGCFEIIPNRDLGTATKIVTVNGTREPWMVETLIATSPLTSTVSTTFEESDLSTLVGVTAMPMVTMIYREADTTGHSTATSNAATRGLAQSSSWSGLLPVLGISAAAAALGAAIILPF